MLAEEGHADAGGLDIDAAIVSYLGATFAPAAFAPAACAPAAFAPFTGALFLAGETTGLRGRFETGATVSSGTSISVWALPAVIAITFMRRLTALWRFTLVLG